MAETQDAPCIRNPRMLAQDQCRKLALWFAGRLDARAVVRRWFGKQRVRPNQKVIEIVRAHLESNGFDGLVQSDAECGCLCDDLAPCNGDFSACEPGYRGADLNGDPGDWFIYRTKAAALESVAAARSR